MSRTHARLSASRTEQWMSCAGSTDAQAGLPEDASEYAAEGNAAHTLAEKCLRTGTDAHQFTGQNIGGFEVTNEMTCAVQTYLFAVRACLAENPHAEIILEADVDLAWVDKDVGGIPDAFVVVPFGKCFVFDLKYGCGYVVEADALQFKLLALSCLSRDPESVTAVVVQPRAPHPEGAIRSHDYSVSELHDWAFAVQAAAKRSREPDAKRCAGKWCTHCKAKDCETLAATATEACGVDYAAVIAPPLEKGLVPPPHPTQLTPVQLAKVIEASKIIEVWLKAVKALARDYCMQDRLPGFKFVAGKRGNRKWIDELEAAAAIKTLGKDPYKAQVISPTEAEKLLGKKGMAPLADLISRAEGRPTMAPISDPRPSIAISAAVEFADADE